MSAHRNFTGTVRGGAGYDFRSWALPCHISADFGLTLHILCFYIWIDV